MSQFTHNNIFNFVRNITQKDISENSSLYEVFEDSIQMFKFLSEVKKQMGLELGMLDLVKAETVSDIVEKIQRKNRLHCRS
jgi:Phosphopantetheine attachment site.